MKTLVLALFVSASSTSYSDEECPIHLSLALEELESRDIEEEFRANISKKRLGFMSSPVVHSKGFNYPGLPPRKQMYYLDKANWRFDSIKGEDILLACQIAISERARNMAEQYNKMMVQHLDENP